MFSVLRYLNVDYFVANEALQEDADEPHQSILHVPVLDGLAGRDAVGDVQVHKLCRKIYSRSQPATKHCSPLDLITTSVRKRLRRSVKYVTIALGTTFARYCWRFGRIQMKARQ